MSEETKDDPEYLVPGNQRFSITPAHSVSDPELSDPAFRTLGALGIFGDKNGWCWPGLARLAKMRHMSRQAISKHIQELKARGYIVTQARFDKQTKARKSNLTQIKFDYPLSTSEVDGDATSGVEGVSTSEVDVNAPLNAPQNEGVAAVFKTYEQEITMITTNVANSINDLIDHGTPTEWITEALKIASKQNHRSWAYAEAILKRWAVEGRGDRQSQPEPSYYKRPAILDEDESQYVIPE